MIGRSTTTLPSGSVTFSLSPGLTEPSFKIVISTVVLLGVLSPPLFGLFSSNEILPSSSLSSGYLTPVLLGFLLSSGSLVAAPSPALSAPPLTPPIFSAPLALLDRLSDGNFRLCLSSDRLNQMTLRQGSRHLRHQLLRYHLLQSLLNLTDPFHQVEPFASR